ncbi:MAG: hydroxymethylbilane synthase [Deltaproteobacteria bacterium]|nr:hydroxymethylbilane synthase [Deltaproteobacteria bacterium]
MNVIRIGTRGSALALTQSGWVKRKLEERYPGSRVEMVIIKTGGDRFLETPIQAIGGKGIFVKEIEEALLRNEIDLAVHSMKDLPTEIPSGLAVVAVPEREDSRDVLISAARAPLRDLPSGARIGTGSLRRRAQILHYRSDLEVFPIRGNVDTRLKKLERGEMDAVVMALAALRRMGWEDRVSDYLSPDICLSAVAQGALGLEARDEDWVKDRMEFLHHEPTAIEVAAERAFLARLGGGCHVPVGARAWVSDRRVRLMGVVADPDGKKLFRGEISGSADEVTVLGTELAERLLAEGAAEVLVTIGNG